MKIQEIILKVITKHIISESKIISKTMCNPNYEKNKKYN